MCTCSHPAVGLDFVALLSLCRRLPLILTVVLCRKAVVASLFDSHRNVHCSVF